MLILLESAYETVCITTIRFWENLWNSLLVMLKNVEFLKKLGDCSTLGAKRAPKVSNFKLIFCSASQCIVKDQFYDAVVE